MTPQDHYDQGYQDGRSSRDEEIAGLRADYATARAHYERERDEVARLRKLMFRPLIYNSVTRWEVP